jgi:hypothetical protein
MKKIKENIGKDLFINYIVSNLKNTQKNSDYEMEVILDNHLSEFECHKIKSSKLNSTENLFNNSQIYHINDTECQYFSNSNNIIDDNDMYLD